MSDQQITKSIVEGYDIASLKMWAGNPKLHTDEQLNHIVASIRAFGFVEPILIDEAGLIIGGHGRYLAAKAMGLTQLPVVIIKGLNDSQKRALNIALNQTTLETQFDQTVLEEFLAEVSDVDLGELGIEFDFTTEEQAEALPKKLFGTNNEEKMLVVTCDDEAQQQSLFAEFSERGIKCKIIG